MQHLQFIMHFLAVLFLATIVFGQEAPPPDVPAPANLGALIYAIVLAAVPVLIRWVKQYAASVPAHWLPTVGPLVGAVGAIALHYSTAGVPGLAEHGTLVVAIAGFCLGAIGTGLREIVAQWTKRVTDGVQSAKLK